MKSLVILSLLATTLLITRAHGASNAASFGQVPVSRIAAKVNVNGDEVTAGTSRVTARLRLGSPNRVLADGSWVYLHYQVYLAANAPARPAALVVRFDEGKVASLSMADETAVSSLIAATAKPNRKLASASRR